VNAALVNSGPLTGRTVVVTRPREQAAALADALEALGAEVLVAPTIRIVPAEPDGEARAAVARLADYDLAVFTSANAVQHFVALAAVCGADVGELGGATVVAIGPATATAAAVHGLHVDLVPPEAVAESVVDALATSDLELAGKKVLFPRAREAREVIPDALRAAGALVDVVVVYDTAPADSFGADPARVVAADAITFTAASTVDHFVRLMGETEIVERLAGARLCSIGPVTSEALRGHGLPVAAEAEPHTAAGLVEAVVAALA